MNCRSWLWESEFFKKNQDCKADCKHDPTYSQRRPKQSRAGGSILDKGTSPLLPLYLMFPLAKGRGAAAPVVPAPLPIAKT